MGDESTALTARRQEAIEKSVKEVQNGLFHKAAEGVSDILAWADLELGKGEVAAVEPPQKWIEELGEERAWRRFRIAMAATLPAKDAPAGLRAITDLYRGCVSAMAATPQNNAGKLTAMLVPVYVVEPPEEEVIVVEEGKV